MRRGFVALVESLLVQPCLVERRFLLLVGEGIVVSIIILGGIDILLGGDPLIEAVDLATPPGTGTGTAPSGLGGSWVGPAGGDGRPDRGGTTSNGQTSCGGLGIFLP